MKKILYRVAWLGLIGALALSSCVKDEPIEVISEEDYDAQYLAELEKIGNVVWVDLELNMDDEQLPNSEKVSSESNANGLSKVPTNITVRDDEASFFDCYVAQFDGEGLGAYMTHTPYFVSAAKITEYKTNNTPIKIPMLESNGVLHRVVVVANTSSLSYGARNRYTYSQFLDANYVTLGNETDSYQYASSTTSKLYMSWSEMRVIEYTHKDHPGHINEDPTPLNVQFRRSLAKIQLDLSVEPGYTVTKILMKSVSSRLDKIDYLLEQHPDKAYLFDPTHPLYDESGDVTYPIYPVTIDYTAILNPDITDDGSTVKSFVWYVPRNIRGTKPEATPLTRNVFAPQGATYFEIYATAPDGHMIIYTIYPGEDATRFNIYPNRIYTTRINIAGPGTAHPEDSRIQRFDDIYLDGHSNSYIINPPLTGLRRYYIPITRVNEYWNRPENGNSIIITSDTRWRIDVLWQNPASVTRLDDDATYNPNATSNAHTGLGHYFGQGVMAADADFPEAANYSTTAPDASNTLVTHNKEGYFYVELGPNATQGNFVVVLRRWHSGSGEWRPEVEWSWHFWVTNYNPDYAIKKGMEQAVEEHKFTYLVPNGRVERYGGTIWGYGGTVSNNWNNYTFATDINASGQEAKYLYRKSFMMDRAFGASTNVPSSGQTILLYQYGRKDPIPNNARPYNGSGVALTNTPGSFPAQVWGGTGSTPVITAASTDPLLWNMNLQNAVRNPLTHYSGNGDWARANNQTWVYYDESVKTTSNIWDKSIYDPCPPGWHMPAGQVWEDIRTYTYSSNYTRPGTILYNITTNGGIMYWPYVQYNGTYPVQGTIHIQSYTYRTYSGGSSPSYYGAYHGGTQYSSTTSKSVYLYSRYTYSNNCGVSNSTYNNMGNALPVRCISMPPKPKL